MLWHDYTPEIYYIHIEYLSYRPDPDRVLPAGWVYPMLRRTTPRQVPPPGVGRGGAASAAPPRD